MADYVKIPELARRLDVSEKTARRYVQSGKLPSVFLGGAYRVSEDDLARFLEGARVEPGKGQGRSPAELSFNDVLEEERREDVYTPWLEAVNRYADRWERRIASGNLNLEIVNEFISTLEDFVPTLSRLGRQERAEQTEGYMGSFGPITGAAIARIDRLMDSLIQAGAQMFSNSELERLRQRRDAAKQARERVA